MGAHPAEVVGDGPELDTRIALGADFDFAQLARLCTGLGGVHRFERDEDAHGSLVAFHDVQEVAQVGEAEGGAAFHLRECEAAIVVGGLVEERAPSVDAAIADLALVGGEAGDAGDGPRLEVERLLGGELARAVEVAGDAEGLSLDAAGLEAAMIFSSRARGFWVG